MGDQGNFGLEGNKRTCQTEMSRGKTGEASKEVQIPAEGAPMSQPLSDEEEEVNIAIAVSQLDGAGGSQTADWAKALGVHSTRLVGREAGSRAQADGSRAQSFSDERVGRV